MVQEKICEYAEVGDQLKLGQQYYHQRHGYVQVEQQLTTDEANPKYKCRLLRQDDHDSTEQVFRASELSSSILIIARGYISQSDANERKTDFAQVKANIREPLLPQVISMLKASFPG